MNLASIASGSSGNCIYVGNEKSHFLIDAGISRKRIVEGLSQMEVAPETIQGIFVTHEHMNIWTISVVLVCSLESIRFLYLLQQGQLMRF